KRMFQISDSFAVRANRAMRVGERVRVYWDRSLSRRDDRLKDELSLLDHYLAQSKPASIDLVIFNSSGARIRRVAPTDVAGTLRVAGPDKGIVERRYELVPARTEKFPGAGALWAADRVSLLGAEDGGSRALLDLSRRFSVASPALSFIVLERPGDYLEADIA